MSGEKLPGAPGKLFISTRKDCGLCGFKTCAELEREAEARPELYKRCGYSTPLSAPPPEDAMKPGEATWEDIYGRYYDFILEKFDNDPGPREHIILGNPLNMERLNIKKGDVLYGRPAIGAGCPVTHCGVVMDEPDRLNAALTWCVVGPAAARERGIEIGYYNIIAYEGVVRHADKPLEFGKRYFFLPRYCMLQVRHSGLINYIAKMDGYYHVRLEGIWLG
jgi:hypothetical protein